MTEREKQQIEEMADILWHIPDNYNLNCYNDCERMAEEIYEAGYRKQSEGEWIGMDGDECSKCGKSLSDIMDADSYYAIGFDISEIVACPFCGAKMKGGEG